MLATVVSAFVGIMLAFFREYLDATIRTREQVERQVGMPLLVTVPAAGLPGRRRQHQQARLAVTSSPVLQPSDPAVTEALRYLYTRLKQLHHGQRIQTIVFMGAGPDDDTVSLLANLAIVAASTGERTLLVDSNLRQPALHNLLHCPLTPGLADALATPESWQQVIQSTTFANLHLVAAGTVTPATYAALESPALDTLLIRYKESYDLILCAAPPVLGFTDAAVLGSKVDATCLVLTCGVSLLDTVLEAKSVLEAVQANMTGAILTGYRP
jgi:capsular exopolysaccharide synthesis family protein